MRPRTSRLLRDAAVIAVAAAVPLVPLMLLMPLPWWIVAAVLLAAAAAGLGISLLDLQELEHAGRWLASLAGRDGRTPLPDISETVADALARPGLTLADERRIETRRAGDQEELLERLMDAVPDPVLLLDDEDMVARCNRAGQHQLGIEAESVALGRVIRDPGVLAAIAAARRGGTMHELAFTPAGQADRRYAARIRAVPLPAGGRGVLVLLSEESEQLLIERMRTDFIANVSHELRTPLASLRGFVETLQGPARNDAEARDSFLLIMEEEVARMSRLVADLLSLSRIESGSMRPPDGACDIAALLERIMAEMRPIAERHGVTLQRLGTDDLPLITGDADRLHQAIANLLDNAINYGGDGGSVTLHVAYHKAAPRAAGPLDGRAAIELAVVDEGPGIAREHLLRLTERFYRVDKARSKRRGGTGLGLAIVKHIVRHHQGHLAITSEVGRGSRFTIWLPAAPLGHKTVTNSS